MKKLLLVLLFVPLVSFGQIESVYYTSGASKYESKDYYGAIADYTKAIGFVYFVGKYLSKKSYTRLKCFKGAICPPSSFICSL